MHDKNHEQQVEREIITRGKYCSGVLNGFEMLEDILHNHEIPVLKIREIQISLLEGVEEGLEFRLKHVGAYSPWEDKDA